MEQLRTSTPQAYAHYRAQLPDSVQEIADVIGREKALRLIGSMDSCGKRSWRVCFYVPQKLAPVHPLVQVLGWHDASALVREFGGMILQPSNCNHIHRQFRNATIRRMAGSGQPIQHIAEAVQLSARQVRNILAENPPEEAPAENGNTAPSMMDQ